MQVLSQNRLPSGKITLLPQLLLPSFHLFTSQYLPSFAFSNLQRTTSLPLSSHILLFRPFIPFLNTGICSCFGTPLKKRAIWKQLLSIWQLIHCKLINIYRKEENCNYSKEQKSGTMLFAPPLCLPQSNTSSLH